MANHMHVVEIRDKKGLVLKTMMNFWFSEGITATWETLLLQLATTKLLYAVSSIKEAINQLIVVGSFGESRRK